MTDDICEQCSINLWSSPDLLVVTESDEHGLPFRAAGVDTASWLGMVYRARYMNAVLLRPPATDQEAAWLNDEVRPRIWGEVSVY